MSIHINKVYTRSGDSGTTGLVGGARVPKDDARVECYGSIDELNAVLGMARAENLAQSDDDAAARERLEVILRRLQNELFDLGNVLATPEGAGWEGMPAVTNEAVAGLELLIDEITASLSPLKSFILPGGGRLSAALHLARTVCRRVERLMVGVDRTAPIDPVGMAYINRLSDLLFVLARQSSQGVEFLWEGGLSSR